VENLNEALIEGKIEEDTYYYDKNADEVLFIYKLNSPEEEYGVAVNSDGEARIISCEDVLAVSKIVADENFAFPQIISKNGKIYYFENEESAGEEITSDNVGKYLGMKVAPTSYSTALEISYEGLVGIEIGTKFETVDVIYRLFYIDFAGDYGTENTIYLKADYVESTALTISETYNPDNVQKFNLGYTTTNTSQAKNTGVSWLLDSLNWTNYLDTEKGATAAYGAPSLEMWIRSYNQFLNVHSGLYNANSEVAKTLAYKFDTSGYYVGVKEGVDETGIDTSITSYWTGNYALINKSNNSGETSQVQAQIGMYNPGSGWYWLASPSASDKWNVLAVSGGDSFVTDADSFVTDDLYDSIYGVSALVSLQSEITLELEKE
jgi:hypothetical protein